MEILTVNHGNVFGTGNWFTWHCSDCHSNIHPESIKCSHCGADIELVCEEHPDKPFMHDDLCHGAGMPNPIIFQE